MTILITLENPDRTGAPRMALHYGRALASAGHRVLVACGPLSGEASSIVPELEEAGLEVRRMPALTARSVVKVLAYLNGLVRREGVTCVLGSQQRDRVLACYVAGLTGTVCVIFAQNQHVFRGGRVERWLKEWIYRRAHRSRADLVICVSEVVEREVQRRFGVEGSRTRVLRNGIDVSSFPPVARTEVHRTRRDLGVSEEERLLLNVGRIDRQKGQDLLLHALQGLPVGEPSIRLGLVGAVGRSADNPEGRRYEDRLHRIVRDAEMDEQVRFLGWRDDVPRLLAAADLYVHSARWEGPALCLSVLEAMAAELPVISTDCSGRPEGFEDGEHGWIVPTGDVEALRRTVSEALTRSPEELREMGIRARRLIQQHYDIRRLSQQFVELVEEAAA